MTHSDLSKKSGVLEEEMDDRFNAKAAELGILEHYSLQQAREYEVKSIMAKIEELTTVSMEFKSELQYHFLQFMHYNQE